MSCTVLAVPYALAWAIGAFVTGISASAAAEGVRNVGEEMQSSKRMQRGHDRILEDNMCEDIEIITTKHFIEKDLETAFMDKDLLIKTMEEHGVTSIVENDGKISGQVDSYTLNFEKKAEDKPYTLNVTCSQNLNPEEKLSDLSSEYALNVQEEAYLNIIEKLKDNNMQIEEEVVEDDNTIVLTINIE